MCIFCLQFISAHNVLFTMKQMSTFYIHHIQNMDSISIMIWSKSNESQYKQGNVDLTKNWPKIWFSWKIWKRYWLTHWYRGRTEFEEKPSHQDRNIFRNPSSTSNVEFVYGAVFLVCIISSKKCLNKISCLKAWGQRTHFWHSRVITVYYVHIVHKPNKIIKIHGWFLALSAHS